MAINWNAKGDELIAQNCKNLLSLNQYELPYDLGRGINPDIIDVAIGAEEMAVAEAHRVIETYEPNAQIRKVTFSDGVIDVEVI